MSGYIGNIPVPQATQTRDVFTATSGQTSFATSGYTPGFLDVWLNGVKLVNGTDFTATNGSDVVLASGAATSDIVEVLSYSTYEVNNQAFTGDFSVDGTSFKVDSVNKRVGVGTATPDSRFVVSDTNARLRITDGTNTLSMGQFDGLTNQIGSAGRDLYLLASGANNIKFGTNNTERMNLDSSGRLTVPNQPAWRVTLGSNQSVTNTGYQRINWNSDFQGSGFATSVTFSTGRITVPVSGKYYVTLLLRSEITAFGTTDINIRLNGTEVNRWYQNNNSVSNYQHYGPVCAVINMAANDYLETWIAPSTSGDLSAGNNTVCFFMGHLIG